MEKSTAKVKVAWMEQAIALVDSEKKETKRKEKTDRTIDGTREEGAGRLVPAERCGNAAGCF